MQQGMKIQNIISTCYIIFNKWSKSLFKLHFINVRKKNWFCIKVNNK